jgi:hypothetical protein
MANTLLEKSRMNVGRVVFGSGGTEAIGTLYVSGGADSVDAIARLDVGRPQYSIPIEGLEANHGRCFPKVGGNSMALQIDVTSGHFVFEGAEFDVVSAGFNRAVASG